MARSLLMMTLLLAYLLILFKDTSLMTFQVDVYAVDDDDNDDDDSNDDHFNSSNNDNCTTTILILGTRSFTEGTECDDTIIGVPVTAVSGDSGLILDDTLRGLERHDILQGSEGDDKLYGDEGNDELTASDGTDKLYGGPGTDFTTTRIWY
jgi:Ca2+-binding RTX toxin-like protein